MTLTPDMILAEPAGERLDGWVDDVVFGIDRTAFAVVPEEVVQDFKGISHTIPAHNNIHMAIHAAVPVGSWAPGDDYDYLIVVDGVEWKLVLDRTADIHRCYHDTWMWEQRHGKPWQAALEAHVNAWRAPARAPYSADIGMAMPLLFKHQGQWEVGYDPGGWGDVILFYWASEDAEEPIRVTTSFNNQAELPLAICIAVLLAKIGRDQK